ncbi:hypothetical protein ZWY2020_020635 [Hordeum vulgare]|nr:hypothetical protein ZWY2020_020635 [Hordeum vulgare]
MATAFDSPTSSPAAAPFHDDPFLSFADGGAPAADIHVSGSGGDDFPASLGPYAFRHDSAAAHASTCSTPKATACTTRTTTASSPTPTPSSPTLPKWGPMMESSSTSGAVYTWCHWKQMLLHYTSAICLQPRGRDVRDLWRLAASWVVGWMGTDAHLYDDPEDAAILALLDSRFDAHV